MFLKQDMFDLLDSAEDICPICIPSYMRWDRKKNKTLTRVIELSEDEDICKNTYVFVREEQVSFYEENYHNVNIVALPKVNGLASTRQYIFDYVTNVLGKEHYMDIDDDITDLKAVVYDGKTRLTKAGEVKKGQIIKLGYEISKIAFQAFGCAIGSFGRVRFANKQENSQTAIVTNKGATPRQVMYVNATKLNELGVKRNMAFDPTGDDVGFVAEIAKEKGSMFNIPCLRYAFIDDAVNSVIRNDENRKMLAEYEYGCLKKYPMKHYLRVPFTFDDGSYKFSDIDFTKYRKLTGVKSETLSLELYRKIKRV